MELYYQNIQNNKILTTHPGGITVGRKNIQVYHNAQVWDTRGGVKIPPSLVRLNFLNGRTGRSYCVARFLAMCTVHTVQSAQQNSL